MKIKPNGVWNCNRIPTQRKPPQSSFTFCFLASFDPCSMNRFSYIYGKFETMRILFVALFACVFTIAGFSQKLTIEDAVLARSKGLTPDALSQLRWTKDGNTFSYVEDDALMLGTSKGAVKKKLTLEQINKVTGLTLKRFPYFSWEEGQKLSFNHQGKAYLVDLSGKRFSSSDLPEDAENSDVHKETNSIAFTRVNNLFVQANGEVKQVTNNEEGIVSGQAIARYEFGIGKGTFWSPNGKFLAFYQKDESNVTEYPLVDYSTTPASLNNIKYPMAGEQSEIASVGIYNVESGKSIFIYPQRMKGDTYYFTNLSWTPDNRSVLIAVVTRDQDRMELHQYNALTGEFQQILMQEKDPAYVEPEHPAIPIPGSPNQFLWFSEKSGFDQLYKMDLSGKALGNSKANFPITSFLGFNGDASKAFVMGTGVNPTEMHLFSLDIATMELSQITRKSGYHSIKMSEDGSMFIDRFQSITTPGTTSLHSVSGKLIKELHVVEDPLADRPTGKVELMTINATDGTELHARMIKPSNFDPKTKYPVLVYVYNGPHVQLVTNRWNGGAPLWMNSLAEDGFIVFTVDGRGSDNRGKSFEQAIHRNLGAIEVSDQMDGVSFLRTLEYVDAERMAVHGWSYGGFMTTSLMLKQPGAFQVGVAGGPVIDWTYYEVMYTERYMDSPKQNSKGYAEANLKNHVKNLEGKLLMIHGTVDDVVVMQHNMSFLKTCVDEGVQVDFFAYPGHPHNVRGKDRVHLMTKVIDYIKANL